MDAEQRIRIMFEFQRFPRISARFFDCFIRMIIPALEKMIVFVMPDEQIECVFAPEHDFNEMQVQKIMSPKKSNVIYVFEPATFKEWIKMFDPSTARRIKQEVSYCYARAKLIGGCDYEDDFFRFHELPEPVNYRPTDLYPNAFGTSIKKQSAYALIDEQPKTPKQIFIDKNLQLFKRMYSEYTDSEIQQALSDAFDSETNDLSNP